MIFSGSKFLPLPRVKNFSFLIDEIKISDFEKLSFNLIDINDFSFSFIFESGFISTDKIISCYNNKETSVIEGYVKDGNLFYKINETYGKITGSFSNLDKLYILTSGNPINCDLLFNSNPINYSITFDPEYPLSGNLTGNFYSDTDFKIKDFSLKFLNSNSDLLEKNLSSDLLIDNNVYSGNNFIVLKDIDPETLEYDNSFITYLNTTFNQLNFTNSSYRGNFYSNKILNITESPLNNYNTSSLFNGFWSGSSFVYSGEKTTLDLYFNFESLDYLGNELPTSGSISFSLIPSTTIKNYITGFQLTNSGLYSGEPPTLSFQKYYYVEGISQNFQNLLFSSNCSDKLSISFIGDSSGQATGYLNLRNVRLSGFYGEGINTYKGVFDYVPLSSGDGYTGAPIILWGTGGGCYSLPDVFGESGQFKKIHGTKANIKAHSDYAAGYPLISGITDQNGSITGFVVTGITMTNLGSGYYNSSLQRNYSQNIYFNRFEGDSLNNDASGYFNYINIEDIESFENPNNFQISYNFLDLSDIDFDFNYTYYSAFFIKPYGKNIINIKIKHNLDYTNKEILGTLAFRLENLYITKTIYFNKSYSSDPNALILI